MKKGTKKQEFLNNALCGLPSKHKKLTINDIKTSNYYSEVNRIYRNLGGTLAEVPCNLKKGDVELEPIIVELDEEQHFNRYRLATLKSSIYTGLPKFPLEEYKIYCNKYEQECRIDGKFWTNKSCESQFGPAGERRVLDGDGAPRWKQRAFYDFLKDISWLIIGTQYVRISIYDTVFYKGSYISVQSILTNKDQGAVEAIRRLIEKRTMI